MLDEDEILNRNRRCLWSSYVLLQVFEIAGRLLNVSLRRTIIDFLRARSRKTHLVLTSYMSLDYGRYLVKQELL